MFLYIQKVKEDPCLAAAPSGKPSLVAQSQAQPASNQEVCGIKTCTSQCKNSGLTLTRHFNWIVWVCGTCIGHNFLGLFFWQITLYPWVCFWQLITHCPSCYPKLGCPTDPERGRPQACDEDLHHWWQRCNPTPLLSTIHAPLFSLHVSGVTKALTSQSQNVSFSKAEANNLSLSIA